MGFGHKLKRFTKKPSLSNARSALGDTAKYSGVIPLASKLDSSGKWGHVISAGLGLAPLKYSADVASGDRKFSWDSFHRYNSAYSSYEDAKFNEKHNDYVNNVARAEDANNAEQSRIHTGIAQLRAAYGIDDGSGDPAFAQRAATNHNSIENGYKAYQNDFNDYYGGQLDDQYDVASRQQRFRAAASGQTGGSVDAYGQTDNLHQMLQGRQHIAANGNMKVNDLRNADQARRLKLEDAIRTGGDPYEATLGGIRDWGTSIDNARSEIGSQSLGQAFTYGGNLVTSNANATGMGRRGLDLFGSGSGGNSSGTISYG